MKYLIISMTCLIELLWVSPILAESYENMQKRHVRELESALSPMVLEREQLSKEYEKAYEKYLQKTGSYPTGIEAQMRRLEQEASLKKDEMREKHEEEESKWFGALKPERNISGSASYRSNASSGSSFGGAQTALTAEGIPKELSFPGTPKKTK